MCAGFRIVNLHPHRKSAVTRLCPPAGHLSVVFQVLAALLSVVHSFCVRDSIWKYLWTYVLIRPPLCWFYSLASQKAFLISLPEFGVSHLILILSWTSTLSVDSTHLPSRVFSLLIRVRNVLITVLVKSLCDDSGICSISESGSGDCSSLASVMPCIFGAESQTCGVVY